MWWLLLACSSPPAPVPHAVALVSPAAPVSAFAPGAAGDATWSDQRHVCIDAEHASRWEVVVGGNVLPQTTACTTVADGEVAVRIDGTPIPVRTSTLRYLGPLGPPTVYGLRAARTSPPDDEQGETPWGLDVWTDGLRPCVSSHCYDEATGAWSPARHLPPSPIASGGSTWETEKAAVVRLEDGRRWEIAPPRGPGDPVRCSVRAVSPARDGGVWVHTELCGVQRIDRRGVLHADLPSVTLRDVLTTPDGGWAVTDSEVRAFSTRGWGDRWPFTRPIRALVRDATGALWAADGGLARLGPGDAAFTSVPVPDEVGGTRTLALVGDRLWVGGGRGVAETDLALTGWAVHRAAPTGAPPAVLVRAPIGPLFSMTEPRSLAWLAGRWVGQPRARSAVVAADIQGGLWSLLLASGEVVTGTDTPAASRPLVSHAVAIGRFGGKLCVGGDTLRCQRPDGAWETMDLGLKGTPITTLRAGWLGTADGQICTAQLGCAPVGRRPIRALDVDGNTVWVGDEDGLWRVNTPTFPQPRTPGGPPGVGARVEPGPVSAIASHAGGVWFGGPEGLVRREPSGTTRVLGWGLAPAELDGAAPTRIDALALDDRGRLYVTQGSTLYDLQTRP